MQIVGNMRRIHNTNKNRIVKKSYSQSREQRYKPKGLWYGINGGWREWCENESMDWVYKNNFLVEIDTSNILVINNYQQLVGFSNKYFMNYHGLLREFIDWERVSQEFYGIEIYPYIWQARLEFTWYYGWDCASGCVWDKRAIKNITKE
jgi:hypothetical protein